MSIWGNLRPRPDVARGGVCFGAWTSRPERVATRCRIKAAYLYNFIKYVDWPSYGDTITIGVLGYDPFGTALRSA